MLDEGPWPGRVILFNAIGKKQGITRVARPAPPPNPPCVQVAYEQGARWEREREGQAEITAARKRLRQKKKQQQEK